MLRHRPLIRSVLSCGYVQDCCDVPSQAQTVAWVPAAELLPGSFRHIPPRARRTGPAGAVAGPASQPNEVEPDSPGPSLAVTVGGEWPARVGEPGLCPAPLLLDPRGRAGP